MLLILLVEGHKSENPKTKQKETKTPGVDSPFETMEDLDKIFENLDESETETRDQINQYKNDIKTFSGSLNISGNFSSQTICIDAPWGGGKTSFVNLVKEEFDLNSKEDWIWVEFNPWNFGNSTELLEDYFETISSHYEERFGKRLNGGFQNYLQKITPIIEGNGHWHTAWNLLGLSKKKSLSDLKEEINNKITSEKVKFVVVLDDIDRMQRDEIFMVLKLVKQLSDFNNFIFILNMDYDLVRDVISKGKPETYKNYLEKIVNKRIRPIDPEKFNSVGYFGALFLSKIALEKSIQFRDLFEKYIVFRIINWHNKVYQSIETEMVNKNGNYTNHFKGEFPSRGFFAFEQINSYEKTTNFGLIIAVIQKINYRQNKFVPKLGLRYLEKNAGVKSYLKGEDWDLVFNQVLLDIGINFREIIKLSININEIIERSIIIEDENGYEGSKLTNILNKEIDRLAEENTR